MSLLNKISNNFSSLFYQGLSAFNGIILILIVPFFFSSDEAAKIFQYLAAAIFVATFFDAYFNVNNIAKGVYENLRVQKKFFPIISIFILISFFINDILFLLINISLYYLISNSASIKIFSNIFPIIPIFYMLSYSIATAVSILLFNSSAEIFLLTFSLSLYSACLTIHLIMLRISAPIYLHEPGPDLVSSSKRNIPEIFFTGILSRSPIMLTQSLLLAVSPWFFAGNEIVFCRVFFSLQNALRFLNNFPLVRLASIGNSRQIQAKALWLIVFATTISPLFSIALIVYSKISGIELEYSILSIFLLMIITVFIVFTPHLLISLNYKNPFLFFILYASLFILLSALILHLFPNIKMLYFYAIMSYFSLLYYSLGYVTGSART